MLALACDYLYINDYAVLGPTDPQTMLMCGDVLCIVSSQIFDEFDKKNVINVAMNFDEYIMMKDESNYHRDNINTFKRLIQYLLLSNCNKQKLVHMFCENSSHHHKDFNTCDLIALGVNIYPLKIIHKKMLELFLEYETMKDY